MTKRYTEQVIVTALGVLMGTVFAMRRICAK